MNLTHCPIANPLIVLREESDDWALLFHPDSGETFGLNPTSVAIWKSIDGARSIVEICRVIEDDFGNVPDNAADLAAKDLITIGTPTGELGERDG